MAMIPNGSRGSPGIPWVLPSLPLLGIGFFFSPLSACALRWSFCSFFQRKGGGGGGGGGGDTSVPRVGLFNLYRVHFKRYQESWEVPLVATHHPLGSYSASVH